MENSIADKYVITDEGFYTGCPIIFLPFQSAGEINVLHPALKNWQTVEIKFIYTGPSANINVSQHIFYDTYNRGGTFQNKPVEKFYATNCYKPSSQEGKTYTYVFHRSELQRRTPIEYEDIDIAERRLGIWTGLMTWAYATITEIKIS